MGIASIIGAAAPIVGGLLAGGGEETSKTEIPPWMEEAQKALINRGNIASRTGFAPYMGPTVAATNPYHQQARRGLNAQREAFGFDPVRKPKMPDKVHMGGAVGYSPYPVYEDAMERFREERPGQARQIDRQFVDPETGRWNEDRANTYGQSMALPMDEWRKRQGRAESGRDTGYAGGMGTGANHVAERTPYGAGYWSSGVPGLGVFIESGVS